jgi:hypothetical protein
MSLFSDFLAAAEKGAAGVYHAVLATGAEIATLEHNPLVAPFLQVGMAAANGMLTRAGVTNIQIIEADISAALKAIAAADPTVPSLSGLVGLAGSIATAVVPGAAPIAAAVQAGVSVAEAIIHSGR